MEHNQTYSTEHGSVMEEMVQRYFHGHILFDTDSSAIYDLLDAATRGTKYHATIAPYKRGARKDGRVAYIAMNAQFCGPALWDKIFRDNMNTLMSRTWNGNSGIDIEKYLAMHRHAWIQCQRCADHIQCVIPDERSRVGNLLENISGDNPKIMAAMAAICLYNTPNEMGNEFDKAVAYLLPIADSTKKEGGRGVHKRQHRKISQVIANLSVTKGEEIGRGTSGVEYRFHSRIEYQKLSDEERSDLHQWRVDNPGLFSTETRKGKRVTFENGAGRGKVRIPGMPDETSKTRPDSKKEKNDRLSEIVSATKEQFVLCDEQQRDYAKFEILVDGLSVNAEKKKPANIASGNGNVEDA